MQEMTRGKKPMAAIAEAQKFAERMGYHWMENAEPELPFDLLIFKPESVRIVKVRQKRFHIDPEGFYEKMFPDEVAGLRSLPFPPGIFREFWLKTRGEKVYRRLHVTAVGVGEIDWWGPDAYTNPHARREIPEKPGPTGKFIVKKSHNTGGPTPAGTPPERMPEK
jgi:hypothetical protein